MGRQQPDRFAPTGNRDLFLNMINWLIVGRRPDLDPAQSAGRPAAELSAAEAEHAVLAERGDLPAGRGGVRHGHLVEEEIGREAEGTVDRRRSFGCAGRPGLVVEQEAGGGQQSRRRHRRKMLTIPDDQFQDIRIKKLTGEAIDV